MYTSKIHTTLGALLLLHDGMQDALSTIEINEVVDDFNDVVKLPMSLDDMIASVRKSVTHIAIRHTPINENHFETMTLLYNQMDGLIAKIFRDEDVTTKDIIEAAKLVDCGITPEWIFKTLYRMVYKDTNSEHWMIYKQEQASNT